MVMGVVMAATAATTLESSPRLRWFTLVSVRVGQGRVAVLARDSQGLAPNLSC